MSLDEELERAAERAAAFAADGERVAGVLAAEPGSGRRAYVCSFEGPGGRAWLVLDAAGRALGRRAEVREAVSIAALCEIAVDTAGGGDLEELRAQLLALRLREDPPGIEAAEETALELERTIGAPPHLATPAYLDAVGTATQRLEHALGQDGPSPFAAAMKSALATVETLTAEVESAYRGTLE